MRREISRDRENSPAGLEKMPLGWMKNEPATGWSLRLFHGSAEELWVLAVPTRATE